MDNQNISDFNINEYFENIKNILCDLGYENKTINIDVAIQLYYTYGNGFSEETFAKEVLEVTAENYKKVKSKHGNITILRIKDKISNDKIDDIKMELIQNGYSMNRINYEQLYELYKIYGNGLREVTFATKVLQLSYSNYRKLKEVKNYIAIILKNVGNVENITNQMINDGFENFIIRSYSDFLELYRKYGTSFTETFFSEKVLNITYDNYRRLRRKNYELKILPIPITEKDINNIVYRLISGGYKNKLIDYSEFLQLHQNYAREMDEKYFAIEVLNLTMDMYKNIKLKNEKAIILKEKNSNKNIEKIRQILVNQKLLNKAIDFEELKKLYSEYGFDLSEKEFALDVLDLSLDSYRALRKQNNKDKFRILKAEIPKEIDRIKNYLILKGYTNKKIYYSKLHQLYLDYGYFISERQFSMKVLEISSSLYQDIKYQAKKNIKLSVTILPYKKFSNDNLQKIKQKLIELGYKNKKLSNLEIDELYKQFGIGMTKIKFCQDVLDIYYLPNSDDSKITILPTTDILDDLEIEKIKKVIYQLGYYHKKINPNDTYKLYKEYGNGLTYSTFINKILGITVKQVYDAKVYNGFVKVVDKNIENTMEMVANIYLNEIRYYSKEEILNICKKYDIDLEEFIFYSLLKTVNQNHYIYIKDYINILNSHEKLWIGNNRVSNNIISKYYYEIENKIKKIIAVVKSVYPSAYWNNEDKYDDFQNLFIFFMENGSEIEKNFMVYDDPTWERYFYGKLKRRMTIQALTRIRITKIEDNFYFKYNGEEHEMQIMDKKANTEENALNKLLKSYQLESDNLYDYLQRTSFSSEMKNILLNLTSQDLSFVLLKFQENYSDDELAEYFHMSIDEIQEKENLVLSMLKNNDVIKVMKK